MKLYIRLIPPFLVRFFARPYVAGDSLAKAMDVAAKQWRDRQLTSTLDLLAEGIDDEAMVTRNIDAYLDMVRAVAADERFDDRSRPTLSFKLSNFTTAPMEDGGDAAGAKEAATRICEFAKEHGVRLSLDMESRHWTDFTLETLRELHAAGHTHIGAVLQTRLHRTEADLDALPDGIRVRLVIGIYAEPEDVATPSKPVMKDRMLAAARTLLQRGHYVEFATHDEQYVQRFVEDVVPEVGATSDQYEVQMLFGVPRDKQLRALVAAGHHARLYVPFALGWPEAIAYLRRRLDEYPAMMFMVMRNWLRLR